MKPNDCPGISVEAHLIPEAREHCRRCTHPAALTPLERAVVDIARFNLGARQPAHRIRALLLILDRIAP